MPITRREARRLALLTIADEIEGSLDVSDVWLTSIEGTGEEYSDADVNRIKEAARQWLDRFRRQIE